MEREVLGRRVAVGNDDAVRNPILVAERASRDVVGPDRKQDRVGAVGGGRRRRPERLDGDRRSADGVVRRGVRDRSLKRAGRLRRAGRELEVPDSRSPVEARGGVVVLLRVPEGAIVHGVDRHVAVVAPAADRVRLAARPVDEVRLALAHRVGWVAGESPRVPDLRMDGGVGGAEAERHVAAVVHGDAAHPAPGVVGLVGALLDEARRARGDVVDLEPPDSRNTARGDGHVPH